MTATTTRIQQGTFVRYHGSQAEYHGVYRVTRLHPGGQYVDIRSGNGTQIVDVRVSSVTPLKLAAPAPETSTITRGPVFDVTSCPGSGVTAVEPAVFPGRGTRGTCAECDREVAVTTRGNARKHRRA